MRNIVNSPEIFNLISSFPKCRPNLGQILADCLPDDAKCWPIRSKFEQINIVFYVDIYIPPRLPPKQARDTRARSIGFCVAHPSFFIDSVVLSLSATAGQSSCFSCLRQDSLVFCYFFRRDVLKGELRKDQACLAGNGQPKMPQLGHAWDRCLLLIYSKHEETSRKRKISRYFLALNR